MPPPRKIVVGGAYTITGQCREVGGVGKSKWEGLVVRGRKREERGGKQHKEIERGRMRQG